MLAVGQHVTLSMTLEVGSLTEEVTVSAESPLLDTTTVSSGQNFDRRSIESLPMFSNMPIMLSRFTAGVAPAEAEVQNIFQGYMEGTTNAAGGQVGTGSGFDSRNTGNNYTIDGAANNGFGRRIASSPNSDQIEEMRIETSNFDASQGHGTGLTISMMTRGGTNALRGSGNYTHWNNQVNSPNLQQKVTFKQDPRQEDAWRSGREHIGAFTLGGPVVIPKILDGRGKVFFFANYSMSNDSAPGRLAGTSTVPANRKHLEGDFSDLLLLPSGAGATTPAGHHQYQIFDPLTTRPDPLRPGRVIRDPFPGNIIPKEPVHEPRRLVQEPGVRALPGDGAGAEPELPLADAAAGEQLLPRGRTRPAAQHAGQLPPRLQPLGELPLLRSGQRQHVRGVVAGRLDLRLARSGVPGAARRGPCAVQLVGDGHLDEGAERLAPSSTRRFRATAPISGTRARTWSTTSRRRWACRRTWTISAWRASSASCPR